MSDAGAATLESADILKILEVLPHRYPFLMVDRITRIEGTDKAIGIKNATFNEPHFAGHFPGNPVMPGVLIIEGMAQTAGAICVLNEVRSRPRLVYFLTIDKCKFRKPVIPGDQLEYHVTKLKRRGSMWWYKGVAMVGSSKVAEAEIGAVIAEEP